MECINFHSTTNKNILKASNSSRNLMLFDLSLYGHHPAYIRYLLEYWHQEQDPEKRQLIVLVSPKFLVEHADVVNLGQRLDPVSIKFVTISQDEESSLRPRNSGINRNLRNFQEWFLFCKYAKKLNIDHALLMYYDIYRYPLALRLNPPCKVSGIYFRPTIHYENFLTSSTKFSKSANQREIALLKLVLSNSKLHSLLTIDPTFAEYAKNSGKLSSNRLQKISTIPDPVPKYTYDNNKLEQIRASLGFKPDRKLFLVFGALTGRKGIFHLLEAVQLIPQEICLKIAIALIGKASTENKNRIESAITKLAHLPIPIHRYYQFIPEEDIQAYFEISDYVLALYQQHIGMSGILNIAAEKKKPVLSSNYGLMGEIVHRYQLGLTVDSSSAREIALGIEQMLDFSFTGEQLRKAEIFATNNSISEFTQKIFSEINAPCQDKFSF